MALQLKSRNIRFVVAQRVSGTESPKSARNCQRWVLVTHSAEIATAWLQRRAGTGENGQAAPLVLLDGASHFVRSPHTVDPLCRVQTTVLSSFAESDAHSRFQEWEIPVHGLITSVSEHEPAPGYFAPYRDALRNAGALRLTEESTSDECLEAVVASLVDSERGEQGDESERIRGGLWGLALQLAEWPCMPSSHGLELLGSRLGRIAGDLQSKRTWIAPETAEPLEEAVDWLRWLVKGEILIGDAKLEAIRRAAEEPGVTSAICTRSPQSAAVLRERLGSNLQIGHFDAVPGECERLIVTSFPGRRMVAALINRFLSPRLHFTVYPFESNWLRSWARWEYRRFEGLIGSRWDAGSGNFESVWPANFGLQEPQAQAPGEPETDVGGSGHPFDRRLDDEVVEARFVSFRDGYYAYLTEHYTVPVIRSADLDSILQLRPRKLSPEDVALFRIGADRDVIRMLAEDALGIDAYGSERRRAEEWKTALLRVSEDVDEVRRQLTGVGLDEPHEVTVRQWMYGDTIGPRNPEAVLEALSRLGVPTSSEARDIIGSIVRIRNLHRAAGRRLTTILMDELPGRLTGFEGSGTKIDLSIGEVRAFIVAQVSESLEIRSSAEANRLFREGEEVKG